MQESITRLNNPRKSAESLRPDTATRALSGLQPGEDLG
jgi:hypothetical protein